MDQLKNKFRAARDTIAGIKSRTTVKIVVTAAFAALPIAHLFVLEWFSRGSFRGVLEFAEASPLAVGFDLILLYALFAAAFLAVRKMWAAAALSGAGTLLVSIINYVKFALRGEYFYPRDVVMFRSAGDMAGFGLMPLPLKAWLVIAAVLLSIALFAVFSYDLRVRFYVRLPLAAAVAGSVALFFSNAASAEGVFARFKLYYSSTNMQEYNYETNGFVAAFAINTALFGVTRPEGYSAAELSARLSAYPEEPAAAEFSAEKPDIIVVLSEAFWDPRLIPGTEFSRDPLAHFDRVSASPDSVSGQLLVSVMGGGTVRTEFEVLTGLNADALPTGVIVYDIVKGDIPSYVSRFRGMGYDTAALHTFKAGFYNRASVLPRLGFNAFYGVDELSRIDGVTLETKGGRAADSSFAEYVKYFMDKAGAPAFLFGISMENHGPYWGKYGRDGFDIETANPLLSESDLNALANYVQGTAHADEALGALADYVDARERPTVLVWFGDHLPYLSPNYSALLESGFISGATAPDDRLKLYSTPFVIHANFPLESDMLPASGAEVSTYNLLNAVCGAIGAGRSPFMSYLADLYASAPYYSSVLETDLPPETREKFTTQYYQTYHSITGN